MPSPRSLLDIQSAVGAARWLTTAPADTTHPIGLAKVVWTRALEHLSTFDSQVDELHKLGRYTPKALTEEVAKRGAAAKREIASLEAPLKQVKNAAAKIREQHRPKDFDLAAHAPLVAHVWSTLPQDTLAVEALYRAAIAKGDVLVTRAIENMPFYADHRPRAEVLALAEELRIEAASPADAAALEELDQATHDIQHLIGFVNAEIDAAVGLGPTDHIAAMAKNASASDAAAA